MPKFKRLYLTLAPLIIAIIALAVLLALPSLAAADSEGDLSLSSTGANLPEIAANNTFVAVVYAQSGQVFLRANNYQGSSGWWGLSVTVGSGAVPRLAFKPSVNDGLHIVWADAAGTAIYHRLFTLNNNSATGGAQHTVASGSGLSTPDIAVDSTGRLHVAWATGAGQVQTSLSTNDGANWSSPPVSLGIANASQPVLAVSSSSVHLAFVGGNGATVEYFRSGLSSHSWGTSNSEPFPGNYVDIRNPAIAATSGGNVYLAWDSDRNDAATNVYGLISNSSTNNGTTWLSEPVLITATGTLYSSVPGLANQRRSKPRSTSPQFEAGLRPSLAVTGTNFAAVWQQRPNVNCQPDEGGGPPLENGTAEIYYASHSGNNWNETEVLGLDLATYAIDPDIAVDSSNVRHIVFLKATEVNCSAGGGSNGYAVYYRGPLQTVQGGIYLPILLK